MDKIDKHVAFLYVENKSFFVWALRALMKAMMKDCDGGEGGSSGAVGNEKLMTMLKLKWFVAHRKKRYGTCKPLSRTRIQ